MADSPSSGAEDREHRPISTGTSGRHPVRLTRRRALALSGLVAASAGLTAWYFLRDGQATSPSARGSRPAGWTDATHGQLEKPNYAVAFPQDKVDEVKITIAASDWKAMQKDMTELLGQQGASGRGMAPGQGGRGMPGGRGGDMTPVNPMWVPATFEFGGLTWTKVGVRYKGNSSLTSGWRSGTKKLPLKLDFDQYEDQAPEVENQRFYGFKQLSLANGFGDDTYLREALAYDLLASAGLPASRTAFYKVTLEHGEGPVDLGIYTVVEVVDDTVVDRVFGSDGGNIYEGDGSGASLAAGTLDQIESSFQKENNQKAADWSDVEKLYEVLHSAERTSNAAAWRAKLEEIFEVDGFLKWLGLSAVLQHWDSYGAMTHNYYLYDNPANGRLTWISWDHNLILGGRGGLEGGAPPGPMDGLAPGGAEKPERAFVGGGAPPGGFGGRMGNTSFDKAEVGSDWPLIRFLLDDPAYSARYVGYLKEIARSTFLPDRLEAQIRKMAAVVAPYASKDGGQARYDAAVQSLVDTVKQRAQALAEFVASR